MVTTNCKLFVFQETGTALPCQIGTNGKSFTMMCLGFLSTVLHDFLQRVCYVGFLSVFFFKFTYNDKIMTLQELVLDFIYQAVTRIA